MPRISFREIPQANIADGNQDQFELFARDFLDILGYKITSEPNRGSDGGRDFSVLEIRRGIGGETQIPWLVSCKHNAHSNRSVTPNDEQNISDRVNQHGCVGFIGFYSTIASSGLTDRLQGLKRQNPAFEFQTFDPERIETKLLSVPEFQILLQKYFPVAFESQQLSNYGINLAICRFGRPYPILYRHPSEERDLTVEEVIDLFHEENQVGYNPYLGEMFLYNNILGITRSMRNGELISPTTAEQERLESAFNFQLQHLRDHETTD